MPNSLQSISIMSAISLVILCGCGDNTWKEVPSIEMLGEAVVAGELIRIEPVTFEPAELPGDEFHTKVFSFKGARLDENADLDFIGNVTHLASGGGGFAKTETQRSDDPIRWRTSESQKDIQISYAVLPLGSRYSGRGYFYFYLTDSKDNCVSNIVAWPVKFK